MKVERWISDESLRLLGEGKEFTRFLSASKDDFYKHKAVIEITDPTPSLEEAAEAVLREANAVVIEGRPLCWVEPKLIDALRRAAKGK